MATKLSELPQGSVISVDTETSNLFPDSGGRVSVVSYAYRDPADGALVSKALPFDQGYVNLPLGPKSIPTGHQKRMDRADAKGENSALFTEEAPNLHPQHYNRLLEILDRHYLVFHNAKFDLGHLHRGLRGRERTTTFGADLPHLADGFYWDTQLAQLILDPDQGTSLKPTAERFGLTDGGESKEQAALAPYKGTQADPRFDLIPWSVLEPYAAKDAELTLLLFELQIDRLEETEISHARLIQDQFDLMLVLYRMEQRGIGFDSEMCKAEAAKLHVKFQEYKKILVNAGMRPTPNGARQFFFGPKDEGNLGLPIFPDKLTDGGQPQVDEEVVTRLVKAEVPWAEEYETHEGIKSALSKWYDAWPKLVGEDGRLRTNHKQASTLGGRLAVERFQAQALPHDGKMPIPGMVPARSLFPPRAGYELWEVDVSQAEIRVGTAIAQCEGFLQGFQQDMDAHDNATTLIFDIDQNHNMWNDYRQVAKRINLSIQFGSGAAKIQEQILKLTGLEFSVRQIKKWVCDWKNTFPEMVYAMKIAEQQCLTQGFVRIYSGRERWFKDFEMGAAYKAFNAKTQFTVSQCMAEAMVKYDARHPDTLLLQVHDSMVLELPSDRAPEMVADARRIMVEVFEKNMTFKWDRYGKDVVVPFKADAKRFNLR